MNELDAFRGRLEFAARDATGDRGRDSWGPPLRRYAGECYQWNDTVFLEFEPEVYQNPAFVREAAASLDSAADTLVRLALPPPEKRRLTGPGEAGAFDLLAIHAYAAGLDAVALEQLVQAVGRMSRPRAGLGRDGTLVATLPHAKALADPEIGPFARAVTLVSLSEIQLLYHLSRHSGGPPGPVARLAEGPMGYALVRLSETARQDAIQLGEYFTAVRAVLAEPTLRPPDPSGGAEGG
ncbi:MAG: hypothetical protein ACYTDY_04470 [Planctomycetota bacterium]